MNEKKWLRRIIFLETVAGVPGSVHNMHSVDTDACFLCSQIRAMAYASSLKPQTEGN